MSKVAIIIFEKDFKMRFGCHQFIFLANNFNKIAKLIILAKEKAKGNPKIAISLMSLSFRMPENKEDKLLELLRVQTKKKLRQIFKTMLIKLIKTGVRVL